VDTAVHADPAGRALTVLRPVLEMRDLPLLKMWMEKYSLSPLPGTHADRIPKYLDYLLTYVPAKYSS
jgi:hypothetical protein